ncbi:MAG TPA: carboxymuconolactone decarboxylase family protein [Caulobacterales bacterium]|nr:carboxymuconolactone decarboxylase family protein [Caulobacterales bacterium]
MSARLDFKDFVERSRPVYDALIVISKSAVEAGLEKALVELIKVRASQLNQCAFCLQFHINLARQNGVPQAKLDQVAAWRESALFTDRERAALAWTETLTALGPSAANDVDYDAMRAHFDEAQWPALTTAIGLINLWNRLGVGMRYTPPASA